MFVVGIKHRHRPAVTDGSEAILTPVLNGNHRKAPLFLPKDDVAAD
jgi:hypothetical protein